MNCWSSIWTDGHTDRKLNSSLIMFYIIAHVITIDKSSERDRQLSYTLLDDNISKQRSFSTKSLSTAFRERKRE